MLWSNDNFKQYQCPSQSQFQCKNGVFSYYNALLCAFRFGADFRNAAQQEFLWNMWLNARSYVSHICEGDRLSWKSVRVRGESDILERDWGRYCRRENEKCWQVVREEFRALSLSNYCLKNKTHCLQTKNHTYNGQTRKWCLYSLNCLFWSCLHS